MSGIWPYLLVLVVAVPAVTTLHEAGHALVARWSGYRVTSFGIGRGRPWLRLCTRSGVVLYVGRTPWLGGSCVAIPRGLSTGSRNAVFHLGGLTAQSVLATVLLVLPDWWWVDTVARFNALVFAWNLLPWRIGSVASDGWWFFGQMWAGGRTWGSLLEQRRTLEVLEEQERLRGSPVGAWYASLLLTWIDLLLGGTVETPEPPPEARGVELDALYRLVVADAHRLQGRPVPALGVIRALRADLGAEPLPGLDDLRCILEVRVWLALGEPRTALETLAQITGTGGVVAQEASVLRLAAALQDGEMDDLVIAANHLLARLDGAFLDPPGAVQILWEASLAVQKGGHIALHETLRNSARSAAWRLVERTRSVDRPKLLARLGIPELGESARDLERGGGPRGEGSAPG